MRPLQPKVLLYGKQSKGPEWDCQDAFAFVDDAELSRIAVADGVTNDSFMAKQFAQRVVDTFVGMRPLSVDADLVELQLLSNPSPTRIKPHVFDGHVVRRFVTAIREQWREDVERVHLRGAVPFQRINWEDGKLESSATFAGVESVRQADGSQLVTVLVVGDCYVFIGGEQACFGMVTGKEGPGDNTETVAVTADDRCATVRKIHVARFLVVEPCYFVLTTDYLGVQMSRAIEKEPSVWPSSVQRLLGLRYQSDLSLWLAEQLALDSQKTQADDAALVVLKFEHPTVAVGTRKPPPIAAAPIIAQVEEPHGGRAALPKTGRAEPIDRSGQPVAKAVASTSTDRAKLEQSHDATTGIGGLVEKRGGKSGTPEIDGTPTPNETLHGANKGAIADSASGTTPRISGAPWAIGAVTDQRAPVETTTTEGRPPTDDNETASKNRKSKASVWTRKLVGVIRDHARTFFMSALLVLILVQGKVGRDENARQWSLLDARLAAIERQVVIGRGGASPQRAADAVEAEGAAGAVSEDATKGLVTNPPQNRAADIAAGSPNTSSPVDTDARDRFFDCVRRMLDSAQARGVVITPGQAEHAKKLDWYTGQLLWVDLYVARRFPSNQIDGEINDSLVAAFESDPLHALIRTVAGKSHTRKTLSQFFELQCPETAS